MVDFVYNGNKYNLENLKDYIEKDYLDGDDIKFDFWCRMYIHNMIILKKIKKIFWMNHLNYYLFLTIRYFSPI
jgi:hypothetical protein